MNVIDIPQPTGTDAYDEALALYAALVKGRAIGVHRVGEIEVPGLDPLDAMVVTDHQAADNRFFFSALRRLPARYARLFAQDPFVVPAWSLRVLCYTPHRPTALAGGRDVLRPYKANEDRDERWCRTLEAYCAHAEYVARTSAAPTLKARSLLRVAAAFAQLLAESPALPEASSAAYTSTISHIRRSFFDAGTKREESVLEAWATYRRAFDTFDALMREHMSASTSAQAIATARARLLGDEEWAELDRAYAFHRAWEIDGYHQELASLGFPFGHLFFIAAYPQAVRSLPRVPVMHAVLDNIYRVRRRLVEYTAGA